MGVFAEWQPAYDEAGIVTFPVDAVAKRPRVEHYNKIGRRGSAQLAAKFGEVNALGFMCGARNNLSIVDIDECDEGLVADVFGRLGASPIVARTASGKFHVWYRHNGEGRKIRCDLFPGRAIDILGGGYALAPPSQSEKGGYEFIEGSLADLSRLRAMASIDVPANDDPEITGRGQDCDGAEEGERNITLLRICGKAAPSCGSLDALTAYALEMNAGGLWPPLPEGEVRRTAQSAWKYQAEGRNGFAGDRWVQIERGAHEILRTNPDAAYLYQMLRAEHWGRDFCITNSWSASLPLSLERLQNARKFLLLHKLIRCVRKHKRGHAALYRFEALKVA
mgnify:CR=1 FL=1